MTWTATIILLLSVYALGVTVWLITTKAELNAAYSNMDADDECKKSLEKQIEKQDQLIENQKQLISLQMEELQYRKPGKRCEHVN